MENNNEANLTNRTWNKAVDIPIWEKRFWTLEEASAVTGICVNKLRSISDPADCEFVLWNGSKRLLKAKKLIEWLDDSYSI